MEFPTINEFNTPVPEANLVPLEESLLWNNPEYNIPAENFITTEDPRLDPEQFNDEFSKAEFKETRTVLSDGSRDGYGISTVCFDTHEELVWNGNQGGHVTSYYGPLLQKYTSYQIINPKQEIRQICTLDAGLLALTQNSLRFQARRGLQLYTYESPNMNEMQCCLQYNSLSLLMGGHQDKIIDLDLNEFKEKQIIDVAEGSCAILRLNNRFICAGIPTGKIELRDPVTLNVEHSLNTHNGSLSDFDVQGNYLVTCGFSNSRQGLSVDRFLMVYDLRQMKAINPLQTLMYPLLLKFLPSFSARVVVVSPLGQMQVLDSIYANAQPSLTCLYQVATAGAIITSLDISVTSQCLAFGDSVGTLHLMSSNVPEPRFNTFSRPTEFMDEDVMVHSIDIGDNTTPLSVIPMTYTGDGMPLLSDWPEQLCKSVYRKTPTIDAEILKTMKMQGSIGYAPNPRPNRYRVKNVLLNTIK